MTPKVLQTPSACLNSSFVALRLKNITSDIQNFLDDEDTEMATIMAELLAPTVPRSCAAFEPIVFYVIST
jgi:hypothetical protein